MDQQTHMRLTLAELHDHPRQGELFAELPDSEIEALAEDMSLRGLKVPIHVLPDGTIVSGHQRVRAARRLAWIHIDAVVRHDLAALGEHAIVEELIRENAHRRHLDDFGKARCFAVMRKLMLARCDDSVKGDEEQRDRVARELGFGVCGRTLERLVELLDLPPALVNAVATKAITKGLARRILREPSKVQREIAEDVMAGMSKSAIARKYNLSTTIARTPSTALASVLKALKSELQIVADGVEELASHRLLSTRNLALISRAVEVLGRLRDRRVEIESESRATSPRYANVAVRPSPDAAADKLSATHKDDDFGT